MPNLIYQYYVGDLTSRTRASVANIGAYAERIGAEYRFDKDPTTAAQTLTRGYQRRRGYAVYYEALNMLLDDSFLEYDNVLFCDCDIFAVDGLADNIFDEVKEREFAISTEPFETKNRGDYRNVGASVSYKADNRWAAMLKEKWGIDLPRDDEGLIKVYNSGVFIFSREGLLKARERFLPFDTYIESVRRVGVRILPPGLVPRAWRRLGRFYHLDQYYLHAMMMHAKLDYAELPNSWNCCVPSYPYIAHNEEKFAQYGTKYTSPSYPMGIWDMRTEDARFVHIQIKGSAHFDSDALWRITNRPQKEWAV